MLIVAMAIVVFPKSKSNLAFLESLIIIVFAFLLLVGCLQRCWCHICTHALKVLSLLLFVQGDFGIYHF